MLSGNPKSLILQPEGNAQCIQGLRTSCDRGAVAVQLVLRLLARCPDRRNDKDIEALLLALMISSLLITSSANVLSLHVVTIAKAP